MEFAPIPRDGESVRWSHWGNWLWRCRCGFEASCREDVGGHRSSCDLDASKATTPPFVVVTPDPDHEPQEWEGETIHE
jgi:hypothetical protein